ncbi:MAG: lipid A deacylase LpxR family protein, partial [Flavobacterium sp.]
RYGLTFEQTGFIPTDITDDQIRFGDRPYAGTIALKSFTISTDTVRKSRLVSSLTLGMIGPAAFGDEMQTGIHKLIDDDLPQGWQYQIKNDVIIDYQLGYEKELVRVNDIFSVTSNLRLRLGTLNTNASTGFNITLGLINNPFTSIGNKNRFQVYLYSQPMGSVIGYDATMQGGLFNDNSPYTIANSDVERFTLQHNYGIVIQYRSLFFEASKADITREFKQGNSHRWGGFKIGFKF